MKTVIVTGNAGAGKSTICGMLAQHIPSEVIFLSDRLLLEELVKSDTKNQYSKIIKQGPKGKLKFTITDGSITNTMLELMVEFISKYTNDERHLIVEIAIGPDIDLEERETIRQSAANLVRLLQENSAQYRDTYLIYLKSDFSTRLIRQHKREDSIPNDTFREYFQDGGEFSRDDMGVLRNLGIKFKGFNNTNLNTLEELHESIVKFLNIDANIKPDLGMLYGYYQELINVNVG